MIKKILRRIMKNFVVEKVTPVKIPVTNGNLLENHTAFITGGSSGIGFAIAERFISNGCNVIISGTNEIKLKAACEKLGDCSNYAVMNILQVENIQEKIHEIIAVVNDTKIDIVVNCAGVHGPSDFWSVTPEDWDSVLDVNLRGMYFLCQGFGRYMKDNHIRGHILNISSASALKPGRSPYEISKWGVRSMTLGIAEELIKYGIVVNCLAPGPTATNMLNLQDNSSIKWDYNPTGRVALPEEIANWAVFMVSDLGNYIVGDSFYITGGSGTIQIDK